MTGVSRRELMLGFGTFTALPGAKAKEWGTGRLLSWQRAEGLYQLDADESIRPLILEKPWALAVIPELLHKGARVKIDAQTLTTRDGIVLLCAVGRAL